MPVKFLDVRSVVVLPSVQQRAGEPDGAYQAELAAWLKDHPKEDLPAVVAYHDGARVVLAGGHYRLAAYAAAGRKKVPCDVRQGTERDALKFALSDNGTHGKRRTAADCRKAVETALNDPEWGELSDRQIDQLCGVSSGYTSRVRKELFGAAPDPVKSAAAQVRNSRGAEVPHPQPGKTLETEQKEEAAQPVPGPSAGGVRPAEEGRSGGSKEAAPVALRRDRLGRVLPARVLPAFDAGGKLLEAVKAVRSARGRAAHYARDGALGDFLKRNPLIGPALADADAGLSAALPYCVCPACGEDGDRHCPTCGGCGWLTFGAFDQLPVELKEEARRHAPGDAWEGDDGPAPEVGPSPAFHPPGPGLDALGEPIPKRLRDNVFADEFLTAAAGTLDRLATAIKSSSAWNPWLESATWENLTAAAHQLRDSRPYAVCGRCKGSGCEACLTGGFLPRHMTEG